MSIAFMFSGQGSQYVGMCQDLYNEFEFVQDLFSDASDILGYDVKEVLFEHEALLNETLYTQPLMFLMYVSIHTVLQEKGIESTHTCGLSLGEYGALYDSGCITFEEGLQLLERRGFYMNEACEHVTGKMSAILGLDAQPLEDIITNTDGYVTIANYNTYGQLVISGEEEAVLSVNEEALAAGAKRAILLNTSGPFHSDLMKQASDLFAGYLEDITIQEPQKPLLVNVTGDYYNGNLKELLTKQITSSVYFYQMIEKLLEDGVTTFVEIGPKKTLSSFVKKINRKVNILNVEDLASLNRTISRLEEL